MVADHDEDGHFRKCCDLASAQIGEAPGLELNDAAFAFTTADVVIVKELGLGLALAIGLDATLIRSMLVPATMRVLGDWNWWPSGRRRAR